MINGTSVAVAAATSLGGGARLMEQPFVAAAIVFIIRPFG